MIWITVVRFESPRTTLQPQRQPQDSLECICHGHPEQTALVVSSVPSRHPSDGIALPIPRSRRRAKRPPPGAPLTPLDRVGLHPQRPFPADISHEPEKDQRSTKQHQHNFFGNGIHAPGKGKACQNKTLSESYPFICPSWFIAFIRNNIENPNQCYTGCNSDSIIQWFKSQQNVFLICSILNPSKFRDPFFTIWTTVGAAY